MISRDSIKAVSAAVLLAAATASGMAAEPVTVTSKYKTEFYGLMKVYGILNTHGVSGDDYLSYVTSASPKDGNFSISARATRLGLNVSDDEANLYSKLEIDFLGLSDSISGKAGTSVSPRIRHAYVTLKEGDFTFLAGQTWMLTPLELPDTSNDFFFGYSGALWFRAPQLRVTWAPNKDLNFSVAAVRPTRKLTDSEGTASKKPQAQAQVQAKIGKAKFTLGGALGEWKNTAVATDQTGSVKVIDLGFNIPYDIYTLNGQIWTGENLYDFLGGIGNMGYDGREIKASGGFADLKIQPKDWLYFNAAYGVDHPESTYLTTNGDRTKNSTIMGNVNFVLKKKVILSFETSYMVTDYFYNTGNVSQDTQHYQCTVTYPF